MFPKRIKFRHTLAAIPAVIFWVVSFMFFIMGLSLDDQTGYMLYIAFGLAAANTVIQLIGWDSRPEELGTILVWSWYASYVLGIGTNMVSLINILPIQNTVLEWMVAGSLSFLIEVTPERLFVLAWRSFNPKGDNYSPHQGAEDRRSKQRESKEDRARRHAAQQAERQRILQAQQAATRHQAQQRPIKQAASQRPQVQQARNQYPQAGFNPGVVFPRDSDEDLELLDLEGDE